MPSRKSLTKRELVQRILNGPFSLQREAVVLTYRISVPVEDYRSSAVIMELVPELGFLLNEYDADSAYAVVNGTMMPLTRPEADAIASKLRRTLWIHAETPDALRLTAGK